MLCHRIEANQTVPPVQQGADMDAIDVRSVKVARIFTAFDTNGDGGLSKVSYHDGYHVRMVPRNSRACLVTLGMCFSLLQEHNTLSRSRTCVPISQEFCFGMLKAPTNHACSYTNFEYPTLFIYHLQAELLTFVARVNPTVKFTPVQLTAIADEVCHHSSCDPRELRSIHDQICHYLLCLMATYQTQALLCSVCPSGR